MFQYSHCFKKFIFQINLKCFKGNKLLLTFFARYIRDLLRQLEVKNYAVGQGNCDNLFSTTVQTMPVLAAINKISPIEHNHVMVFYCNNMAMKQFVF